MYIESVLKESNSFRTPQLLTDLCTERLLLREVTSGVPLGQIKDDYEFNPQKVGKSLVKIYEDMIFNARFANCDINENNILVRKK